MSATKTYPVSDFKPLTQSSLQLVWQWRNQPDIRRNMHNDAPISWDEHLNWFESVKSDLSRRFFLFYQDMRPIGVLNFKQRSSDVLEWGCYLGENNVWPGSGLLLEIAALDYAAAQLHITHLYAEVLSFNQSVLKMHQLFGYQSCPDKPAIHLKTASTSAAASPEEPYCIKVFQYQTAHWRAMRSNILARLPKQISAAADYIHFQD